LLLAQSLRTTSTLFSTMLPHLKLELFLSYLIDRLTPPTPSPLPLHLLNAASSRPASPAASAPGESASANQDNIQPSGTATPAADVATPAASTPRPISLLPPVPGETKELMLETLTQIALRPSFMVDLWTNFDCSTESEDLFERLVGFLTRVSLAPTNLNSIRQ
jgi:brefeldin A-resistance guanine nucleotide exchange factor 1